MATSGNMTTTNSNIWYWIEAIQNSQDVANNTSNVTVRVWFQRTSGYTSYGTGTVYCKINGSVYSDSVTTSQKITSTPIKLFEHTLNVAHNADGTKTLDMSAYISHSVVDSSYQSWSMGLTTIARASSPTMSDTTIDMGTAVTIYTNRASSSFTHTVSYAFGSASGTISSSVATSVSWTPSTSLASQIPNATSGKGTITCKTYSGSTLIGTKTVGFTLYVPSTIVPTFTSVTHWENSSTSVYGKGIGAYVQGLSKVSMSINGASGAGGSTIKSYSITFDGSTYSTATPTSGYVNGSGSLTITAKITDSRGRTATKTATATVLSYSTPKITTFTVDRCNSAGTLDPMGTYAKITRIGTVTNLNSKNYYSFNAYSKERALSTWTLKANGTATAGTVSMSQTSIVSVYDVTKSYDFKMDFSDLFNTVTSTAVLSTGGVTMSWGREGVGVGKVWEQGALDVGGEMRVTGVIRPEGGFVSNRIWANTDLNNIIDTGWYYCPLNADAQTLLNSPVTTAFSLLVEKHAGVRQTLTMYLTTTPIVFFRNSYGTTWSEWFIVDSLVADTYNSNGRYIRYMNGMQICWHDTSVTNLGLTNGYNVAYHGTWRWTFPASFSGNPIVSVSEGKWGTGASFPSLSSKTSTYADIRLIDFYSRASGTTVILGAMAIGRWR